MVLLTLREVAGIMMKMKVIKLTYVIQNDKKAVKLPLLEIADSKSSAQINTAKSESF